MKFKIDQNLPLEFESILAANGHDAISVFNQGLIGASDERIVRICHDEQRALITADLDLSDIRAYPPQESAGYIVFRLKEQTRPKQVALLKELHEIRSPNVSLVFHGRNPEKPMDFKNAWEKALLRAGIVNFRWHDIRHTTGTYLGMSGAKLADIAEILGHKTLSVTKRYVHVDTPHKRTKIRAMHKKKLKGDLFDRAMKVTLPGDGASM